MSFSLKSYGDTENLNQKEETERPLALHGVQASSKLSSLQELYKQLAQAPDEATAEQVVGTIEKLWSQSGSPTADLLLGRALAAADSRNFDAAMQFLSRIIDLYPNWPEAYNRRAYLYVLRHDYTQALTDLRRVLSFDSGNFRALEGLVRVLRALGQTKGALEVNQELLKAHPFSPGAKRTLIELEEEVKNEGI